MTIIQKALSKVRTRGLYFDLGYNDCKQECFYWYLNDNYFSYQNIYIFKELRI